MLLLCDIAMILMNFHTLLIIFGLTYYLSAPQCQFLFSAVFLFQVSPLLKVPEKFREKYRKNQHTGSFAKSPRGARGEPEGPGGQRARPGPWPRQGAPGAPVQPLAAPFRLFIPRDEKPSGTEPFFAISPLFHRRRDSKIGSTRRPLPGTLPEGGITSGSFSTTMDASRMIREYSTLDHGSMISSYVMFSSPLCSSWIRPRELPYMIEALM